MPPAATPRCLERSQDETLLPTDYASAGMIVDDELNALLVRPLAAGVTLHALIDACHSGTAMDLPFRAKWSDGRFSWKVRGFTRFAGRRRGLALAPGSGCSHAMHACVRTCACRHARLAMPCAHA